MTTQIQELSNRINGFDFYYDYSDSHSEWSKWNVVEISIKADLDTLTQSQLYHVKSLITKEEKHLNFKFGKYFEGLTHSPSKTLLDRSFIFKMAWKLFNGRFFETFSEALKASWARYKLVSALRKGQKSFSFIKANGERRDALGTLIINDTVIKVKKEVALCTPQLIKYFDIDKQSWRSCRVDRLIAA